MSYYKRHVFFCCNKRDPPEKCCADAGAADMQATQGPHQGARARTARAGCASTRRAASTAARKGPCIVVYPEAVWYTYVDREDIDEIIDRHIVKGEIVERLRDLTPKTTRRATDRRARGPARGRAERSRVAAAAASRWSRIRIRCRAARSTTRSCRRSPRRSSRWATSPCASTSAASGSRQARSTTASARPRTRWPRSRMRAGRSAQCAAGRARRLLVRRVRADARRAARRRAQRLVLVGPAVAASPSRPCPPTRSSSTARRTTSCRSRTCSPGRGRRSCRRRVSRLRSFLPRPPAATCSA